MNDYRAFSKNHKRIKWLDYQLTRHELEETNELCHSNYVEIQHLYDYINKLKAILDRNNIDYPEI
ncbi:MAG: mobility-associated LCxxNW protein [Firmicutes bacterium]|nr:mobility-associated LCxxNW protein [Bacillota bacterium]